ncbi:MAG TPA: hypothetical protein VEA59_06515 [Patescibacteria group bacterium]|nr:hypothetical protein [Patescibacteria group bacterium]
MAYRPADHRPDRYRSKGASYKKQAEPSLLELCLVLLVQILWWALTHPLTPRFLKAGVVISVVFGSFWSAERTYRYYVLVPGCYAESPWNSLSHLSFVEERQKATINLVKQIIALGRITPAHREVIRQALEKCPKCQKLGIDETLILALWSMESSANCAAQNPLPGATDEGCFGITNGTMKLFKQLPKSKYDFNVSLEKVVLPFLTSQAEDYIAAGAKPDVNLSLAGYNIGKLHVLAAIRTLKEKCGYTNPAFPDIVHSSCTAMKELRKTQPYYFKPGATKGEAYLDKSSYYVSSINAIRVNYEAQLESQAPQQLANQLSH